SGVFGRRYDASGVAVGGAFQVDTSVQYNEAFVANAGSGGFLVAWKAADQNGVGTFGRFYASTGQSIGERFPLNTYTANNQYPTGIGTDGFGRFLVVWNSASQDGSGMGVYAERLYAPLAAITDELRVNTLTTLAQSYPRVAVAPNGDSIVV